MPTFAERLKYLRERAGLTQASLAQQARLSIGIVRDYEQGRKEPALRSAFKLTEALGVSCEAFKDCIDFGKAGTKRLRAGQAKTPSVKRGNKKK